MQRGELDPPKATRRSSKPLGTCEPHLPRTSSSQILYIQNDSVITCYNFKTFVTDTFFLYQTEPEGPIFFLFFCANCSLYFSTYQKTSCQCFSFKASSRFRAWSLNTSQRFIYCTLIYILPLPCGLNSLTLDLLLSFFMRFGNLGVRSTACESSGMAFGRSKCQPKKMQWGSETGLTGPNRGCPWLRFNKRSVGTVDVCSLEGVKKQQQSFSEDKVLKPTSRLGS